MLTLSLPVSVLKRALTAVVVSLALLATVIVVPVSPAGAQAAAAEVAPEATNPALTLRTMSFNILWSYQSEERMDTLAEYIRDQQLDVVALQEVNGFTNRCCDNFPGSTAAYLTDRLAELGWPMQRGEVSPDRSLVFFSRYPMTDVVTHYLGEESRYLQTAMVELPERLGSFRIANNHPETTVEKCAHATAITNVLESLPHEHTVVLGDFNTRSTDPCMSVYLESLQRTCPVDHPDCVDSVTDERSEAIDMILHSKAPAGDFAATWHVLDAYSDHSNDLSDHLPVLATFAVPGARRVAHFEDGLDPRWEPGNVDPGMTISLPVYELHDAQPPRDGNNFWDVAAIAGLTREYADMTLKLQRSDWTRYSTLTIDQWGWSQNGSGNAGIRIYAHDADGAGNNENNGYHLLGDFTGGVATIDLTSMTNRDEVDALLFRSYASVFASPNNDSVQRWHVNDIALGGYGPDEVMLADFETGVDRRLVPGGTSQGMSIDPPLSEGNPPQPGVDDMNYWDVRSNGVASTEYADMIMRVTPQDWTAFDQLWIDQWGWSEGGSGNAEIEIYVYDGGGRGNSDNNGYERFGTFKGRAALDLTKMANRSSVEHILFRTRASTFADGTPAKHRWHLKGIELRTHLLGDVTCDHKVDVVDALAIMQFEVGLRTAIQRCPRPADNPMTMQIHNADVNRDGRVNVIDALFIMRCEVGFPNTFCPADEANVSRRQANSPVAIASATSSNDSAPISVHKSKLASPR